MQENRGVAGDQHGAPLGREREMALEALTALLKLYEQGHIKPHVDRSFPFEQAAEAHGYIEAGQNVGKVLLTP